MARIAMGGFETADPRAEMTGNLQTFSLGTSVLDATVKRTGSGSWKYPSGSTVITVNQKLGRESAAVSGRTYYVRCHYRFDSYPAATRDLMKWTDGNGLNGVVVAKIDSSGRIIGADGTLSSPVPTGSFFCLEVSFLANGTNMTYQVRLEEANVGSTAVFTTSLTDGYWQFGRPQAALAPDFWIDDWAVNDDQGSANNSWCGKYGKVLLLKPVADSAIGSNWLLGDGSAPGGVAFEAVNNYPPIGTNAAGATAGSQLKQDGTNTTAEPGSDADVAVDSYTAAGIGSGDTIIATQGVFVGSNFNSGAQNQGVKVQSNPADGADVSRSFGGAAGVWPTSWTTAWTVPANLPTVTMGTRPVVRFRRLSTLTGSFLPVVAMMGLYVEYSTATPQTVSPSGIASGGALGSPTLVYTQAISPSGIASAQAFGTPIMDESIAAIGVVSAEAFGAPVLTRVISPTGIASAAAFGTASIRSKLFPGGIASATTFGTPSLGNFIVGAGGIASGEQIGPKDHFRRGHSIQPSGAGLLQTLLPIELESDEAVGTPLIVGNVVGAGNIGSAAAVGSPTVVGLPTVTATGIASAAAFGTAIVALPTAAQTVSPAAIAGAEAFGSPTVALVVPSLISVTGIVSAAAFGAARVYLATVLAASPELDVLTDLATSERYVFPISHSAEDPVSERRAITYGAPAQGVTAVRQQEPGGDLVLRISGEILQQAQYDELRDFNDRCEDRTLAYSDYAGNEYEVLITSFDARPVRVQRNPRDVALQYVWAYTLEMQVIAVRAGAYV